MEDRALLGGLALVAFLEHWPGSGVPELSLARAVASSVLHWTVTEAEGVVVVAGTRPFVDAYLQDPDAAPPWGWDAGPAPGVELRWRDIDRSHHAFYAWEDRGLMTWQNPEEYIAQAGTLIRAALRAHDLDSARALGADAAEQELAWIWEQRVRWSAREQ